MHAKLKIADQLVERTTSLSVDVVRRLTLADTIHAQSVDVSTYIGDVTTSCAQRHRLHCSFNRHRIDKYPDA